MELDIFTLRSTCQYSQSRQLMVPAGGFWRLWSPRSFIPRGSRSVVPWMGMVRVVIENAIGVVRRALPVPFRECSYRSATSSIKKPLDSLRIGLIERKLSKSRMVVGFSQRIIRDYQINWLRYTHHHSSFIIYKKIFRFYFCTVILEQQKLLWINCTRSKVK